MIIPNESKIITPIDQIISGYHKRTPSRIPCGAPTLAIAKLRCNAARSDNIFAKMFVKVFEKMFLGDREQVRKGVRKEVSKDPPRFASFCFLELL